MITIISGTNRKDGLTHLLANYYHKVMKSKTDEQIELLSLEHLPNDMFNSFMYGQDNLSESFINLQDKYITPADKLFFVIPEYNGSYPGILKLFIDACSVRKGMQTFRGKKTGMVGIATGRAGNIRGLEHLTSVMMFMGTAVLPNLLPLSMFKKLLNTENEITDEGTLKAIEKQVDEFLQF